MKPTQEKNWLTKGTKLIKLNKLTKLTLREQITLPGRDCRREEKVPALPSSIFDLHYLISLPRIKVRLRIYVNKGSIIHDTK
jgi:hypothetical protein